MYKKGNGVGFVFLLITFFFLPGKGKVSGSLIMGKLGSYARQNKLATALREMRRIEKTIFILDYISNEGVPSGKCGFTTLSPFSSRFPHF